ncbi:MAG: response regulator [Candidatus Sumerlaeota bacterium]|nr:response regulator [Candidatus Sumerlaeota bacterium]
MTRILVIDDEEQVRKTLQLILEQAGYEVIGAPDGNVGIELFRKNPTDLVITDLLMPEKEGLETIMEIRRDFPDAKIIAISGGGREGALNFLAVAQKMGAAATLSKPFERKQLLEAVTKVLGNPKK